MPEICGSQQPVPKESDKSKTNIYIMYFDANNLYGDAMFRPHQKKRWHHIESCTPEQQKYTREKNTQKNLEKHLLTLKDKSNYMVHYCALKFYQQMGMKLKKLHRVLDFDQRASMKENSKRKRSDIRFLRYLEGEEKFQKLVKSPFYQSKVDFGRKLAGVRMKKKKVIKLNRPV